MKDAAVDNSLGNVCNYNEKVQTSGVCSTEPQTDLHREHQSPETEVSEHANCPVAVNNVFSLTSCHRSLSHDLIGVNTKYWVKKDVQIAFTGCVLHCLHICKIENMNELGVGASALWVLGYTYISCNKMWGYVAFCRSHYNLKPG